MSKKFPKNIVDPDFDTAAYSKDLTRSLLSEIFKIIEGEQKTHGREFAHGVVINLLGSYVSTVVYNALKAGSKAPTPEAQVELASILFAEVKRDIEDAIAQGFANAFQNFDPESAPDYQCDITCLDTGYSTGPTQ